MILPASQVFSADNSSVLYNEAAALAKQGQYEDAEKKLNRVIELSPDYVLGHYALGKIYLYKPERLDDAVRELRLAHSLDKKYAKASFYLGFAYFFQKKYTYCINAFFDAYQADRNLLEALYNIGVAYDLMDNSYKSRKFYKLWLDKKRKIESDEIDFGF